jgi:riboflavin transporter FmnP
MKNTRTIAMMGLLIAVGCILPVFARMIPNGGTMLSPMHIAPLLAGLVLGPIAGMIVGLVCPLLNSVLFGMPQGATLIAMCIELPVYGLVSGCLMNVFHAHHDVGHVYTALIAAMICGRIVGGITQALVLGMANYSLGVWASSYFISTAPGIAIHLLLLPPVYFALKKARLVKN